MEDIVQILGCQIQPFPIKYLGLLQTTKKIPKAEVQTVVEAVAWKLPPCHGFLMVRRGRLVWIKSVLRSVPVYTMMAESLPPWARKEIDSICRKFFWAGNDNSVRGKCMHGSLGDSMQADGTWGTRGQRPQTSWLHAANAVAFAPTK